MVGPLVRLRGELADDREVLTELSDRTIRRCAELEGHDLGAEQLAWIAVQLHRWYTGLESALARIERAFGTAPSGTPTCSAARLWTSRGCVLRSCQSSL